MRLSLSFFLWFPVLPPQLAYGRMMGRQRSLRSERENDFSETGGRDGRNRRFLIRPPPVAENAVSYRQKRRTDGETETDGRTDGRRVMGTEPGEEKCYLFAGDNATAATAFFHSAIAIGDAKRPPPPDPL